MDVAAVQVDDPAGDGEAESGPAVGGRARGIGAVEAFEDTGDVVGGDTRTLVDDLDGHAGLAAARPYLHGRAGRGVSDRVLEQVGHHLVHALGVAVGGEAGVLDLHVDRDAGDVEL